MNQQRCLRRRKDNEISHLKVKIAGLIPKHNSTIVNDDIEIDSVTTDNDNNEQTIDEGNDFVGETIWGTLTPRTKGKVKNSLKNQILPRGLNRSVRKQLGVNLSKFEHVPTSSALCKAIIDFFEHDDVSRRCPDKRRKVRDPDNEAIKEQVSWRLGYLSTLHLKFLAETEYSCSYVIFTKYVPSHIKKPAASDWGT